MSYTESKGETLDMRIIRGPDGRGLGNYFLERSTVVKTESATATTPTKMAVT